MVVRAVPRKINPVIIISVLTPIRPISRYIAMAIFIAYHSINGIPNCLHHDTIDAILKTDMLQEANSMSEKNNVYRHVVLFKFHDNTSKETVESIVKAFHALCAELPFVKDFEWGQNSSPENLNEGYTHCFIVTFASAKDRDAYLPHPAHQAFCRNHLDENLDKVCVVDFTSND
jgi:hypothetical protein